MSRHEYKTGDTIYLVFITLGHTEMQLTAAVCERTVTRATSQKLRFEEREDGYSFGGYALRSDLCLHPTRLSAIQFANERIRVAAAKAERWLDALRSLKVKVAGV